MFAAMIPPTMAHAQQQMLGMFTKGIAERIPKTTPPINAGFILSFMFVYTFTQSRQALGERGGDSPPPPRSSSLLLHTRPAEAARRRRRRRDGRAATLAEDRCANHAAEQREDEDADGYRQRDNDCQDRAGERQRNASLLHPLGYRRRADQKNYRDTDDEVDGRPDAAGHRAQ